MSGCPDWCARESMPAGTQMLTHYSASRQADGVSVWLFRNEVTGVRLGVAGLALRIDAGEPASLASLVAVLGHAELAALITRTAEMAGGQS